MIIEIPSVNLPKLEKKLEKIRKKCQKYDCSFKFEKVGEIVKKYKNTAYDSLSGTISNEGYNIKFIKVDVEGTAVIGDWEFIAAVDHLSAGNVIRKIKETEVPVKYRNTPSICEHCNTIRKRNSTYIIRNTKTNEFKQVGKSCLKDYTGGLSAEHVGVIESFFHEVRESTTIGEGCHYDIYENLDDIILFSIETVKKFGYRRMKDCDAISGDIPTSSRVFTFMKYILYNGVGMYPAERKAMEEMVNEYDFTYDSPDNIELKDKIKEWISTTEDNSEYMHDLKVIFSEQMVDRKYIGMIASSVPAYKRAHPVVKENVSEYQGKIGNHLQVAVKSFDCVFVCESFRRTAKIYRIIDNKDNVYIWRTSVPVNHTPQYIDGIVKEHNEYKGVKQTVLTRCKIIG